MILSRRSFLKMAGLTVVAAAGASMFTGCNANNFFSTGVVYSAKVGSSITEDTIKKAEREQVHQRCSRPFRSVLQQRR